MATTGGCRIVAGGLPGGSGGPQRKKTPPMGAKRGRRSIAAPGERRHARSCRAETATESHGVVTSARAVICATPLRNTLTESRGTTGHEVAPSVSVRFEHSRVRSSGCHCPELTTGAGGKQKAGVALNAAPALQLAIRVRS